MTDAKPPRGSAKRERRRKRQRARDAGYLAWLHTQPCIVPGCKNAPAAHHERRLGKGDAYAVSLCTPHHQGPQGRHGLRSLTKFERLYGINIVAEIRRLRSLYDKEEPHAETANEGDAF